MSDPDQSLDRIAARARHAPVGREEMPLGFDTRVLAGLRPASGDPGGSLWAVFAVRALPCAASVFALLLVLQHFTPPAPPPTEAQIADDFFQQLLLP